MRSQASRQLDLMELLPNKTTSISVLIDGFTESDDRANVKMDVTGFIVK